jgi:CubicO group peptidase (beta-lactamase class C family)
MPDIEIDETLPGGQHIAGHHDPAFAAVADAFRANFETRREIGASVCVVHRGRPVVDLWGGTADAKTGRAWQRDTISIVFSCTKGATALCAHMLAAQGKLGLYDDVATLWPDFAQAGKAGTRVAHMLGHTSPVPHLRAVIPPGGIADYDAMIALIEAEPAFWEPGTRQGYHGVTFAWTVGHLVRLAGGRPLGAWFADHVAGPLGLDFHIGLPESEEPRVAPMLAADPAEADMTSPFLQAVLGQPGGLPQLFMTNTGGADFNSRLIHACELGSANGITNARGLAGMYAPLAAGGGGLLPAEDVARMARVSAATHLDATLLQPMRFGMGFMVGTDNRDWGGSSLLLPDGAFGHVGMGGSLGFADPSAGLSFGYSMNRMGAGILLNGRGQSLVDAAYAGVGC